MPRIAGNVPKKHSSLKPCGCSGKVHPGKRTVQDAIKTYNGIEIMSKMMDLNKHRSDLIESIMHKP